MFVTLDGPMSGPNGELDWMPGTEGHLDNEVDTYLDTMLNSMDTMLLGARTYELFVDYAREEIERLRRQPGKDLVMFGGATLAQSFIDRGLIDEPRLFMAPIILGNGKSLFRERKDRLLLTRATVKTFASERKLRTGLPLLRTASRRKDHVADAARRESHSDRNSSKLEGRRAPRPYHAWRDGASRS